jgi:hypothetical protein
MHSHVGLQEQRLLAAPLIVSAPGDEARDEQEIVLFLQDFTFRAPEEILAELKAGGGAHAAHAQHGMVALNDVEHDAYLANEHTLGDPEVVAAERNGRVRLRVINATAATNLWLDLGALEGTVMAVDGKSGRDFPSPSPSGSTSGSHCPTHRRLGRSWRCGRVASNEPAWSWPRRARRSRACQPAAGISPRRSTSCWKAG